MGLSESKVVPAPTKGVNKAEWENAVNSHRAQRFFKVHVGVLYTPQIGRRRTVRAVPRGSRADDVPSKVAIVRSDGSSDFRGGRFGDVCRSRGIKQDFKTADGSQYNRIVERAIGLV